MTGALSPADRERLETLFERAADLPRAEQAAWIERECGTAGPLQDELVRMLAGHAGENVLERLQPEIPARVGMQIGRYRLLEKVGEGGMGEVYAAEQLDPVVRRVALKIIRAGMDSAAVVARFEMERQVLALMTHPNVSRVLDAGAAGDGSPYFVMEFVAGQPITEYCDREKLSTRERLALFLGVCEGVRHAHLKGVIHRDLKPSNVLVMEEDGRAVPKVIDFGVARATRDAPVERLLQTLPGQVVGTLDYMSPEQADPSGAGVDTRSDVYSLGALLYQLLSGLLPFEHDLTGDKALSEVQRAIREHAPPTPSTRLRKKSGTAMQVAPLHGTDERSLMRELIGDLDWICLKALEKDPARRYQSAAELADDVRRHLAHQPVHAGRPSVLYRAQKFVRRNRVGVAAAALALSGVGAGTIGFVSGRLETLSAERSRVALLPQADEYGASLRLEQLGELWPAEPAKVAALAEWIEGSEGRPGARELASSLGRHRASLEALRARALPAAGADSGAPLESAPEAAAATPATWSFESFDDSAAHSQLTRLVERLESLGDDSRGPLALDGIAEPYGWSVPKRLAFARHLQAGFAPGGAYSESWEEHLPAIRAAYPGLELVPQLGLLPLGPDPETHLWEFAHLATGEPAQRVDGKLVMTPETGLVLILVPGGSFEMGSERSDADHPSYLAEAEEKESGVDGHPVLVTDLPAFFVSRYEMTQGQWTRGVGANPSAQRRQGAQAALKPVNGVSWTQCSEAMDRLGLKLPSEEEWEYAARASTSTHWWSGNDVMTLQGVGNVFDESSDRRFPGWKRVMGIEPVPWDDGEPAISDVHLRQPNAFGLHDVHGNVAEWCSNVLYSYGRPPELPDSGPRVARSGSARDGAFWSRSAARRDASPEFTNPALGLRPARDIVR